MKVKKKSSIDALFEKYKPKTNRTAAGARCLFEATLPKEAYDLAVGLRERSVTLDEIGRILAEEFDIKGGIRGESVGRHLRNKCRCARV